MIVGCNITKVNPIFLIVNLNRTLSLLCLFYQTLSENYHFFFVTFLIILAIFEG